MYVQQPGKVNTDELWKFTNLERCVRYHIQVRCCSTFCVDHAMTASRKRWTCFFVGWPASCFQPETINCSVSMAIGVQIMAKSWFASFLTLQPGEPNCITFAEGDLHQA